MWLADCAQKSSAASQQRHKMKVTVFHLSLCVFQTLVSSDTRKEATLRVEPNRSQFFVYESVSLSCVQLGRNSSDWTVKRNTSTQINQECSTSEERTTESGCFIDALYPFDGGVYWCESAAGESCDAINITVTGGHVILDSPVLPVMEGDDVTLSCREKTPSSDLTADFYKDGLLLGSSSTGNMTIHSVSKSDEGFYKCSISGAESPDSRLTVTGPDAPAAPVMSVHRLICHAIVGTPYLLSTIILGLICRDNRRATQLVAEDRHYYVVMEME